jgi:RHS repeat-associated protein
VTTYAWDNRDRLTGVSHQNDEGGAYDKVVQYKYDVFNRLVSKDVTTGGSTQERYVYDGANLTLVLSPSGSVIDRCLNGPAVDQVLAEEDASGKVSWMLADNQGSVRDVAVYDAVLQQTTVTDHLDYDAYGNLAGQTPGATSPRFTYAGGRYDADAQLYYNGARWYDAKTGRFVSEDPSGFGAGDVNLNRYCGNSPMNYTDPTGLYAADSSHAGSNRGGAGGGVGYGIQAPGTVVILQVSGSSSQVPAYTGGNAQYAVRCDASEAWRSAPSKSLWWEYWPFSIGASYGERIANGWYAFSQFDSRFNGRLRERAEVFRQLSDPKSNITGQEVGRRLQQNFAGTLVDAYDFACKVADAIAACAELGLDAGLVTTGGVEVLGELSAARRAAAVEAQQAAKQFLGPEFRSITNKAGDKVFESKDGLRKIRFDIKNSHGDAPHVHVQVKLGNKWVDAIPGKHRLYPK